MRANARKAAHLAPLHLGRSFIGAPLCTAISSTSSLSPSRETARDIPLPTDTLWYSGDGSVPPYYGFANGAFDPADPSNNISVYAPFDIPDASGWNITGLYSNNLILTGQSFSVDTAYWEIRSGMSTSSSGTLLASGTSSCTPVSTGRTAIGYTEYLCKVSISKTLPVGTYWMTVTPINKVTGAVIRADYFFNSTTSGANSVGIPSASPCLERGYFFGFFYSVDLTGEFGSVTSNGVIGKVRGIPCLHPETLVLTTQGEKLIKDVKQSDYVINYKGGNVKILYNICFEDKVNNFVRISKGSLGDNLPAEDILIRRGHPILYNGREENPLKLARKLGKQRSIRLVNITDEVNVYSLCTKRKTYVMMQGVPVATWSIKDWQIRAGQLPNLMWSKK